MGRCSQYRWPDTRSMDSDFLVAYVHGRHTVREYFDRFVRDPLFDAALADCPTELARPMHPAALVSLRET
jgi:hypothetical protein